MKKKKIIVIMTLLILLSIAVPLIAPARAVTGDGFWQTLMRWERAFDQPVTAFPAFRIPGLSAVVPPALLAWHETKWLSRGVLCRSDEVPILWSAVHERVVIR